MKAMIFAAGIGSRLRPFTLSHPKALVEVGGVPMLGRVIGRLKEVGVTRAVVNVHHFADQIVDYLRDNGNFGLDITVSDESARLLDTGGGLLKAATALEGDEPVLLHNADILTDFPIAPMLEQHVATRADVTLLADTRRSSRCLYFDRDGRMRGWGNLRDGVTRPAALDASSLTPLAFGGVHIITPSALMPVLRKFARNAGEVFSITDFYIAACSCLRINAHTPAGEYRWVDVGRIDTLATACDIFAEKSCGIKR